MTTADLNHHTRSIRGLVAYSGGRLAEEGLPPDMWRRAIFCSKPVIVPAPARSTLS
ncbi:hypothetical protein QWZ10_08575 [Paracoccus cavernae]|uniref:Uncharacterized protein n=1 Tax=Paracoccus cavernae TaxID=1571207 RepID=A0ABT8D5V3_9RHOB|nr:hypothetical protein [Paracoccus cavernae]